jgi:tRNA pseudouridine-54 N-methylase
MSRVLPAKAAVLAELEPLARLLLVLCRAVVAALTFVARQRDDVSHYSILVGIRDPGSAVRDPIVAKFVVG